MQKHKELVRKKFLNKDEVVNKCFRERERGREEDRGREGGIEGRRERNTLGMHG